MTPFEAQWRECLLRTSGEGKCKPFKISLKQLTEFFLPVIASSFDMAGYIKSLFSFSCNVSCNTLRSLTQDAEKYSTLNSLSTLNKTAFETLLP